MSTKSRTWTITALCWTLVLTGLGWTTWQQSEHLNLSATAGGQSPYLNYASGMAEQGITSFVGDRNRMPIVPAITAIAYDENPITFFKQAKILAMLTSLLSLTIVGVIAYKLLPILPASALTLTAAVCVFLDKASFVQAELLYYSLSLATWLLLCKLLTKPTVDLAALTGASLGISYLTKGSALPLLISYSIISLGYVAITLLMRGRKRENKTQGATTQHKSLHKNPAPQLVCIAIVTAVFLVVISPYLQTNHVRFNRYFYNVNSTFFFWCDNWDQAKSFADTYQIDKQYPQATDTQIPSAYNYWQSHSLAQMVQRFGYGIRTLAELAWHSSYAKYFIALAMLTVYSTLKYRKHAGDIIRTHQLAAIYTILTIGGYLVAYAWYVPVAYGDRFLLSLLLPALFSLWWLSVSINRHHQKKISIVVQATATNVFSGIVIMALILEGGLIASVKAITPTTNFIRFYYNESREAQLAGDIDEAIRGYQGIIKLDPTFVAAHRELGMAAMMTGAFEQAVKHLQNATALKPDDADLHNSLGSAIIQTGQAAEALASFKEAVRLDPTHAIAWYNLGGTCIQLGNTKQAILIADKLKLIDPARASQLRQLIANHPTDISRN